MFVGNVDSKTEECWVFFPLDAILSNVKWRNLLHMSKQEEKMWTGWLVRERQQCREKKIHSGPLHCTPTSSGQLNASAPVNTLWASAVQIRLSHASASKLKVSYMSGLSPLQTRKHWFLRGIMGGKSKRLPSPFQESNAICNTVYLENDPWTPLDWKSRKWLTHSLKNCVGASIWDTFSEALACLSVNKS